MKLWINFEECLKDSPTFRVSLENNEHFIWDLEAHLEKVVRNSGQVIDNAKQFSSSMASLLQCFDSLSSIFVSDDFVSSAFKQLTQTLGELQSFVSILVEQTQQSILYGIHQLVREDIKKVKDTKKVFDKISDELDNALHRNSQLPKTCKSQDAEEAENVLQATQSCFSHTALDYAFLINSLQSKKRFHIVKQIVTFTNGLFSFYKQGCEVLNHFEPYLDELSSQLENMQEEHVSNMKEMEERHTLVQLKNAEDDQLLKKTLPRNKNSTIIMDGYLFKRASNAFKTWNRRWFVIQNNKLYYQKRSKAEGITELVDLRLSTVKQAEDVDRRFSFAVVCPTKCWYLQADNSKLRDRWIAVMQMAIVRALNEADEDSKDELKDNFDNLEKLHPQFLLTQMRSLPGNDLCADCGNPSPKWASINIGVVLCIECSGIHRSLGVHISKVRSITLDDWEAESIKMMTELGNDVINNIYEAEVDEAFRKPQPSSSRQDREAWIQAKYVRKRFVSRLKPSPRRSLKSSGLCRKSVLKKGKDGVVRSISPSPDRSAGDPKPASDSTGSDAVFGTDSEEELPREGHDVLHPSLLLFRSAKTKNISMMALAIANGADVNWKNEEEQGHTALIESVSSGSVTASEFLLQNGADVNLPDAEGRNCLHHAALQGSTGHTCLFLKRHANQQALDKNNQDPLTIALHNYHADIVTLLRLALLHEEIKETDLHRMGGDETVTNVFRDFSNMASQNPEKLKRDRQTVV